MSTVEFSEGLFDSIPIDKREIFIEKVIEKAGHKFFVYDCKEFDFEPHNPHKNDQNKSYQLTKAKICKTKVGYLFPVEKEVIFHVDINKRKIVHADFKFKDSLVFQVEELWTTPIHWYDYCIRYKLNEKPNSNVYVNQSNTESTMTEKKQIGKLSDDGWVYINEQLNKACKDDPGGSENMIKALYLARKGVSQRKLSYLNSAKYAAEKYNIPLDLLVRRQKAYFAFYRWANKKYPK